MADEFVFQSLKYVTTPLSLVAFLAAVAGLMHARAVGRAERLIRAAPPSDRGTLVGGALDILNVKTENLTREQRYELALEILGHRRHRMNLTFGASLFVALSLAGLAAYSFARPDLERDVANILSTEHREAAMPLLNRGGIFEAVDRGVVDYIADIAALPKQQQAGLSELQLDIAASERYDSIASVRELRRRATALMEPFTVIGDRVTASVPDRVDHPWQFFVNVPMDSKLANRRVKVTSVSSGRYIRVFARGVIDPAHGQPKVHLNREQASYLEVDFPVTGRFDIRIKETLEDIYDPNCSVPDRALQMQKRADELCKQGESVTLSYLQSFLSR